MQEEITKAEINAMIEVQAKSAEQLATIANCLKEITNREEKIINRLYNGLGKEITESIVRAMKDCEAVREKEIADMKKVANCIKSDVSFLKWIYGGLFALIGLAWLILQIVTHLAQDGVIK